MTRFFLQLDLRISTTLGGQLSWLAAGLVPLLLAMTLLSHAGPVAAESETAGPANQFVDQIVPFLDQHCVGCHGGDEPEGGMGFDTFSDSANVGVAFELWEKVRRVVSEGQMPPADEAQPEPTEVVRFLEALEVELSAFDCAAHARPGRVTLRRLNKAEYDNTIRDLVGLDLQLAADFPSDDVGHGFDNIGDVLSVSPILLEKYLAAAERVAEEVWGNEEARRRVFVHEPSSDDERIEVALRNVREFAERAYRRPLRDDEQQRLFELMRFAWEQDSSEDEIFRTVIAAILSNPNFLFRVEQDPEPDDADGVRELDGFELASRMSYFLWSSMPDQQLLELARAGQLTQPDVLRAETRRMLADPKSQALVDNFAGQWLQLRDVSRLTPDPGKFPEFDDELRTAMRRETELFFAAVVRENRSVLEFLNADFSFLNARLAQHYGVDGVTGAEFQRVPLGTRRRGVLTHASILMLTSNPTRTSPVKRGKWILENMLAEPPPPPPPNVPELEENAETLGSLREQMEQHRANPSCAVCHIKMDALGFGLENFDAVGQWRDRDGQFQVDASGQLPGGHTFNGAAELMQILVTENRDEFCRCLAQKLLTYALGRGLESYDRCTVNDLVDALAADDYRFESLITAIVTSKPFTQREGKTK